MLTISEYIMGTYLKIFDIFDLSNIVLPYGIDKFIAISKLGIIHGIDKVSLCYNSY